MTVTTVRLKAEVERHLEAIAGRLHRSKMAGKPEN